MRHKKPPPSSFSLIADMNGAAERPDALVLIEWLLDLVNQQVDPSKGWAVATRDLARGIAEGKSSDTVAREREATDRLVTELRMPLAGIHGNRNGELPESLRRHVAALFESSARVVPDFGADASQFTLRIDWNIEDTRSRAYLALALLAASLDLRSRLGRCALDECGKYFLDDVSRGGKRRLFCTPAHSVTGRTRLYRERLKDKPASKRKPK